MTTIVYDHKAKKIACDSRFTSKGLIINDSGVKFLENEKGVWFFSGKRCDNDYLAKSDHNKKCDVTPDCSAIVSDPNGNVMIVTPSGDYIEFDYLKESFCIGSGCDLAYAALDFGKSAKEAVEYAMTRDIYTGGKVRVYDVVKRTFI